MSEPSRGSNILHWEIFVEVCVFDLVKTISEPSSTTGSENLLFLNLVPVGTLGLLVFLGLPLFAFLMESECCSKYWASAFNSGKHS
ncbi:hypothetical protein MtrunA17_Chr7g0229871 [Medicago truncatula]|uniref:Transmembrane protein n=1 Tax=Medicago truncatula TaxID=3880 RepID=A0A396H2K6_MEDTR|nr:hypothetical protein MtrunA17_Chr7g0229871 [Medicago truncatula]